MPQLLPFFGPVSLIASELLLHRVKPAYWLVTLAPKSPLLATVRRQGTFKAMFDTAVDKAVLAAEFDTCLASALSSMLSTVYDADDRQGRGHKYPQHLASDYPSCQAVDVRTDKRAYGAKALHLRPIRTQDEQAMGLRYHSHRPSPHPCLPS